jgi:hypothetical protein
MARAHQPVLRWVARRNGPQFLHELRKLLGPWKEIP